jgi:hypothetical protein
MDWAECSNDVSFAPILLSSPSRKWLNIRCCFAKPVYVNGVDNSVPSMLSVMPNVIEKSVRTVVVHGGVDYVLIAEGTRCVSSIKISVSVYSADMYY